MYAANKLSRVIRRLVFFAVFGLTTAAFIWQHISSDVISAEPQEGTRKIESKGTISQEKKPETEKEESPKTTWQLYLQGVQQLQQGDAEEAVASFEEVLQADPDHLKSKLNLTRGYLLLEQFEDADTTINEAVTIDSTDAEIHLVRGRVMESIGEREEAISSYKKSIELDPDNNPYAYNNLGLIYILEKKQVEALPFLEKAVEQKDDVKFFYNNLGLAYEASSDFTKAKEAFQTALEIDPGHDKSATNLVRIKTLLGEKITPEPEVKHESISEDSREESHSPVEERFLKESSGNSNPNKLGSPSAAKPKVSRREYQTQWSQKEEKGRFVKPLTAGIAVLGIVVVLAGLLVMRNKRYHS